MPSLSTTLPRTHALIVAGLAERLHIGCQLYISLRGNILVDDALGLARPDPNPLPMRTDTLTVWLSAGKPMTAVAIGQLVDAGVLSVHDRVVQYIPEFAPQGKDAITLLHLLTHTAGLRAIHTDWPRASWEQTIEALCAGRMEKDWIPGQKAGYHAFSSWYVLGEIVRRVSGLRIEDYLRQRLFLPLGMTDCYLAMDRAAFAALSLRLADPQRMIGEGAAARPESLHYSTFAAASNPRPAGGVRGPIRQLGLFYESLLRARKGDTTGPGALWRETALAMTAPARVGMYDHTFKANIDWGLGFQVNSEHLTPNAPYNFGPYASRDAFGHGGSQSSMGMADPAHALVVAVVFNGSPGEARHQERNRAFLTTLYEELGLAR